MEIRFRKGSLDRLEMGDGDGDWASAVVKAYRRRIQFIRDARDERDFRKMKSMRFEKLKGTRKHQWSMRLNDQWRLILEFEGRGDDKVVCVVDIVDHH
ncbi:type II toxin-antitoxin system RelE/ParE family toxin [bacterium]|nr:type II toxin-antitoxin system RelE/ParE family toxin [bacterium]